MISPQLCRLCDAKADKGDWLGYRLLLTQTVRERLPIFIRRQGIEFWGSSDGFFRIWRFQRLMARSGAGSLATAAARDPCAILCELARAFALRSVVKRLSVGIAKAQKGQYSLGFDGAAGVN